MLRQQSSGRTQASSPNPAPTAAQRGPAHQPGSLAPSRPRHSAGPKGATGTTATGFSEDCFLAIAEGVIPCIPSTRTQLFSPIGPTCTVSPRRSWRQRPRWAPRRTPPSACGNTGRAGAEGSSQNHAQGGRKAQQVPSWGAWSWIPKGPLAPSCPPPGLGWVFLG